MLVPTSLNLPGEIPALPPGIPTEQSLLAEAAGLGDRFSEVTAHPADLIADADEMEAGREDLPEFKERKYAVSEGHFVRLALLKRMITPIESLARLTDLQSQELVAQAEAARTRLLEIRESFERIVRAARLPTSLASLQTRKTDRLNVVLMRMDEVLLNLAEVRDRLPDQARVDQLCLEARALIDAHKQARRNAKLMRRERTAGTRQQERLERLLLDTLMYLSAQGLAAFPDDPVREVRYRLDHVWGRRPSVVGDPDAGGTGGTGTGTL